MPEAFHEGVAADREDDHGADPDRFERDPGAKLPLHRLDDQDERDQDGEDERTAAHDPSRGSARHRAASRGEERSVGVGGCVSTVEIPPRPYGVQRRAPDRTGPHRTAPAQHPCPAPMSPPTRKRSRPRHTRGRPPFF